MKKGMIKKTGFSLIEVTVASAILIIAVTMAMAGFFYALRSSSQNAVQDELDIDVQTSMERIKTDLRLSSLDEMCFYPSGSGPYTAMSFPMARDDNGDGVVDLDENGQIIWDQTLVYHVFVSSPNELRLTVFDPRDNTLTEAERQTQINDVVSHGDGTSAANGDYSSSRTIFKNLFDWEITPRSSTYDGYAPSTRRDVNVVLGSVPLSSGSHTFKFTVSGKNPSSSGYEIGLDTLFVSPSYCVREAEAQLPSPGQLGATAIAQYMVAGSWSGNYQLSFPATQVDHYFTLIMANDRWEETNFRRTGYSQEDTTVEFDLSGSPYDFVVELEGCLTNWYASEQTLSTGEPVNGDELRGMVIRNVVKGSDIVDGGFIRFEGNRCIVYFEAGTTGGLWIEEAYIHEAVSTTNPIPIAGAGFHLKFNYGSTVSIPTGEYRGSDVTDPVYFNMDPDKTYLVTYMVKDAAGLANAMTWQDSVSTNNMHSYIITSGGTLADVSLLDWNSKTNVLATNVIVGLKDIWTSYPTNGVYTSGIFDTRMTAPPYFGIEWTDDEPSDSSLSMKVRTGANSDMSAASAWSAVSAMSAPGVIVPGNKRYVQFQATLTPDSNRFLTPKLKDVAIKWTGQEQVVDIGGTFTQDSDYGIFKLEVDGQELKQGVMIELEIFKDTLGFKGTKTMTSGLTTEVRPRNSGK